MYLMKLRGGGGAMERGREGEGMRREKRERKKARKAEGGAWEKARDE